MATAKAPALARNAVPAPDPEVAIAQELADLVRRIGPDEARRRIAAVPIGTAPLPFGPEWLEAVQHAKARYLESVRRTAEADAAMDAADYTGDDSPTSEAKVAWVIRQGLWDVADSTVDTDGRRLLTAMAFASMDLITRDNISGLVVNTYQPSRVFISGDRLHVMVSRRDEANYQPVVSGKAGEKLREMMLFCIPLDRVHSLDGGPAR